VVSDGSRIFIKGMRNRGSGGRKSPAGSRDGAPVGVWPPEARDIMLNSQLITNENFNIKNKTTRQKHDNLAQEIKLVWSSQSELVNDFDRFDWCRLHMYVDQRK